MPTLTQAEKIEQLQQIQDRMIGRTRKLEELYQREAVLRSELETLRAEQAIDVALIESIDW
jgi:septal ring factor EnvC (AmiA/AmiB activator)